jgi:hypothetical protein
MDATAKGCGYGVLDRIGGFKMKSLRRYTFTDGKGGFYSVISDDNNEGKMCAFNRAKVELSKYFSHHETFDCYETTDGLSTYAI